jgi:RNA polymerase sigma-70 factor (ECF subfamily)
MEDSDEALVGRYVRGEAAAFDQLYKRHELRAWRYLERSLRHQATSDELLQEVWFALSRNAVSLESATRFRTRLFTLTHDRMSNSMRDRPQEEAEATGNRPTRDAAGLGQAIGQLPREQREALLLQTEGQLSVGEIAEITEATIDATQASLRAAKLQLRDLLGEGETPANPDDFSDVDQMYRRLSGSDAGRPGEWVRRKVQAYSAQQAAERSVRETAKAREGAAPVATVAPAPAAAAPRVVPAPTPRATPAPAPKQSASKPWLLPVIGAGIVVVLVAIFVVPSLRAPAVPTVTPPPPPVPPVAPPVVTPTSVTQTPSVSEPAPTSQAAEPEVASPAAPPPAPAQVAQASEEPRETAQPAPAPVAAPSAPSASHTPPQPKTKVVAHQDVAPQPSPPVASARKPETQAPAAAPPVTSAPVQSSPPAAVAETRQASVAATPPPPPVAAAAPQPAPTPVPAPAAAAKPLPPPDDFYRAAETGDMGRLQEVLAANFDVNALDAKGRTALILAIGRGHVDVVKALLAHGADANKIDSHGMTPKAAAHSRGNFEINTLIDRAAKH